MWSSPNENRKPTDPTEISEDGSYGDETELVGAERTLLCETIDTFLDRIQLRESLQQDDPLTGQRHEPHAETFETGIGSFDRLSAGEQLAFVHSISLSLVNEMSLGCSQSSTHDATVAALIVCIRENVEVELDCLDFEDDFDECESWRELIRNAAIEYAGPDGDLEEIPSASDVEMDRWSTLIDQFADRWLPDHDFALADLLLDAAPDQSMAVKENLGIQNDYFISTANEPADKDFKRWLAETRQLVRRKPR